MLVLCNIPSDCQAVQGEIFEEALHYQPHGRTHPQRNYPVLCICGGKAKGTLLEHSLLKALNQSEHHILQLSAQSRTACQEDYRAWVLLLLYSCKDAAISQKQSVPRLP